ncbi:hypothetical protein K438DRAFT_1776920 [Mycena galopus ATCC 62051]|nr:hypothetical protein K438DRAFT_1776920 [Mycena galopus ATCC 62051]
MDGAMQVEPWMASTLIVRAWQFVPARRHRHCHEQKDNARARVQRGTVLLAGKNYCECRGGGYRVAQRGGGGHRGGHGLAWYSRWAAAHRAQVAWRGHKRSFDEDDHMSGTPITRVGTGRADVHLFSMGTGGLEVGVSASGGTQYTGQQQSIRVKIPQHKQQGVLGALHKRMRPQKERQHAACVYSMAVLAALHEGTGIDSSAGTSTLAMRVWLTSRTASAGALTSVGKAQGHSRMTEEAAASSSVVNAVTNVDEQHGPFWQKSNKGAALAST